MPNRSGVGVVIRQRAGSLRVCSLGNIMHGQHDGAIGWQRENSNIPHDYDWPARRPCGASADADPRHRRIHRRHPGQAGAGAARSARSSRTAARPARFAPTVLADGP